MTEKKQKQKNKLLFHFLWVFHMIVCGFSVESEWQQVSSNLQVSSQYFSWSLTMLLSV